MKKNQFSKISYILILIIVYIGCEKDDTTEPLDSNPVNSEITFNPKSATWYARVKPDSVVIEISNGVAPYVISTRSQFAAQSQIRGNKLILFPAVGSLGQLGKDFVTVTDNAGNINSFNIEVQSLTNDYTDIVTLSLSVLGDTTFNWTIMDNHYSAWDSFDKTFELTNYGNNGDFSFRIFNIDSIGSYNFNHIWNLRIVSSTNLPFNQRFDFNLIDTNQVVNISKIDANEIIGNLSVMIKDNTPNFTGTHTANCSFHFRR